nr:exosome complex component rrp45a [Quercus suber]
MTAQLTQPYKDRPNEGTLWMFTEFSPMADPSFEPSHPSEAAVELGRVIDRGLRESRAVDTESLCVLFGKSVWAVRVDLHILDNGGNLVDAANIAALVALLTFRRPECSLGGEDGQQVIVHPPEVVDPSHYEEAVMGGRMTATLNANNDICAIQKAGGEGILQSVIMQCLRIAGQKASDITTKIKNAVKRGIGLMNLKQRILKAMGLDQSRHNISIMYRAPQLVVGTQVVYNSLQLSGGAKVKMMWAIVEQMVVKGFIASELYVTVEPTIVEAGEGSQHNVLDGTVDEHIDSIPLQSYQGWAENTRDGYGSEPWQTFPGVNSTEKEERPQEVHEGEHLSHDELHGGTFENEDDHGLGDDANHIDVTRDDFEEFLDTMGEHEDVDHIENVVVEENRDTCPSPDPMPKWFTKNTWDNMFDPSPVMQAEVSSWTLGEQPLKGMIISNLLHRLTIERLIQPLVRQRMMVLKMNTT